VSEPSFGSRSAAGCNSIPEPDYIPRNGYTVVAARRSIVLLEGVVVGHRETAERSMLEGVREIVGEQSKRLSAMDELAEVVLEWSRQRVVCTKVACTISGALHRHGSSWVVQSDTIVTS